AKAMMPDHTRCPPVGSFRRPPAGSACWDMRTPSNAQSSGPDDRITTEGLVRRMERAHPAGVNARRSPPVGDPLRRPARKAPTMSPRYASDERLTATYEVHLQGSPPETLIARFAPTR